MGPLSSLLCLLVLAIWVHAAEPEYPPITSRITSAKGSLFFDELGRSRIFRGTNVVYKAFPYVPQTSQDSDPLYSFNQKDISLLASNGVTAVRLGVLWAGVEPTKGNYNQTYLTELTKIVQMCSDVGIYVLLDFHQDIMSERFCGQGVPSYIVDTNPSANSGWTGFPVPLRFLAYKTGNGGIPSAGDCQSKTWTFYQTADSVVFLYQQLYENKDGVRDAFISFWTMVAKTFLPFKNILGYDLINEPFMGNIYTNPLLLDPLYANRVNLQPFYDVVSTAIRTVDPNAIIHFEPATLIQKSAGFTNTPGGKDFSNKSVFNFHYYADAQRENGLNDTLGYRIDSAISLNCGAFLGEFEMGYNSGKNLDSIRQTFQAADLHLTSATGWEYKEYIPKGVMVMTGTNNGLVDSTGSVREDFAKVFSRPYAHAIAGIPTGMAFDDGSKIFTLNFTFNGQVGVSGTTEIRGNFGLFHKPYGSEVKVVSTSGVFSMLPGNGVSGSSVFVAPDSANLAKVGANVTITVLARTSPPPAPAVTTTVTASAIAVATKSGIIPLKPLLFVIISFFFFL
ncbi:glycoside hydrolase [Rhizoclosmatium globosum]|uniref:Glycoside hydrolase n=1 Tax=Rhizoclosmatium globosum TaxID=329046 RepID=A0A1Y2C894_9FUNG|nr:glycoside hydrolase [Rhizoclosmatium globosum]|eukprot:ORY43117.1 glycoside hydrolase [Rhizoclosmatium globosum]